MANTERMNPRTRRVRRAILDAGATVFLKEGADRVTAARVATEADVARTTIYRHWPTSPDLLLAVIEDLTKPGRPTVNTGDFEADLRSTLLSLCVRLRTRETRRVFGALASRAHESKDFARTLATFTRNLTCPVEEVLEAAIASGALCPTCDCRAESIILTAPLLHHHFMLHTTLTDDLVETVVVPWLAVNTTKTR